MKRLQKALDDKMRWGFNYEELTNRRRSGMTDAQRWLRKLGIKELDGEPTKEQRDRWAVVDHPAPWTVAKRMGTKVYLLVPKELAVKVETLGCLP